MKIILREDIAKVGKIGEVVKVRPGFARNFLLPQGKAERASREAVARFAERRAEWEARQEKRREFFAGLAGRLDGYLLQIAAKAGADGKLYGSVTAMTVCHALNAEEAFRDLDFSFQRGQIRLPGGAIKEIGEHEVEVRLENRAAARLKISVLAESDRKESAHPPHSPQSSQPAQPAKEKQ